MFCVALARVFLGEALSGYRSIQTPASQFISSTLATHGAHLQLGKHIEESKEDLLPRTPGKKSIDNLPRGTHDLAGKMNEGVQEAPELQALNLMFLGLPPFRPWPAFG